MLETGYVGARLPERFDLYIHLINVWAALTEIQKHEDLQYSCWTTGLGMSSKGCDNCEWDEVKG